jgi:hypothetical protein
MGTAANYTLHSTAGVRTDFVRIAPAAGERRRYCFLV